MTNSIQPIARPPLIHESVQEAIRTYILDNRLQPGDVLPPETELARQLNVGRNSVREGVKVLEALGILEVRRGSGLFVRDFTFGPILDNLEYDLLRDLQELADILQVRRVLETGMIAAAMQVMGEDQRSRLRHIGEAMRTKAERNEDFFAEDREFHHQLYKGLNNQVLLKLLDTFWLIHNKVAIHSNVAAAEPVSPVDEAIAASNPTHRGRMRTYQTHALILEALFADDVAGTVTALHRHFALLEARIDHEQQQRTGEAPQ